MAEFGVAIEGLDEIRKDLRRLNSQAARAVNEGQRDAVRRFTLPAAKKALGGQRVPSRPQPSVSATVAGSGLRWRAPWAAGGEFGSKRFRQFKPWVGNQFTGAGFFPGYVLGAAVQDTIDEVEDHVIEHVEKAILRRAGL